MLWPWIGFGTLVAALLSLDLLVFHRRDRAPTLGESALWTVFWCGLALAFNGFIWLWQDQLWPGHKPGHAPAVEFLTGYVVEWALSMDNVFVFAIIFRFFSIPLKYQYRVLFWGILGAVILRLLFVVLGSELINRFEWILPLFGLFLVYTAFKLAVNTESEVHPEKNILLRLARRVFKVSQGDHREHGHAFFVREGGRWCFTPLFLVLLVVESTDVLFAVDSVPAIFGITQDIFIIYTSNIFAILGLRALYFLLAGMMEMFGYLHYGLSAILGFIGVNMIADYWFKSEGEHFIPTWGKLATIAVLLGISIAVSIVVKKRGRGEGTEIGEK
jgi:tellurite resistance protein TerC